MFDLKRNYQRQSTTELAVKAYETNGPCLTKSRGYRALEDAAAAFLFASDVELDVASHPEAVATLSDALEDTVTPFSV
jgi:hypothetical protein